MDRWKSSIEAVVDALKPVSPEHWKSKALDGYDEQYVDSQILVQSLITGLGSDYLGAWTWLEGIKKIQGTYAVFNKRREKELKEYTGVLASARDLVAVILAYNVMHHKFDKADATERRQAIKDLKNKLRTKPGKTFDRLQKAVHSK